MIPLIARCLGLFLVGLVAGGTFCVLIVERHLGESGAFYVEYKQAVIRALTVPLPLMSALGVVALIVDGYGRWQADGMAAPTWLTLTALGLVVIGGVITKAGHFPINDSIMTWKREAPPPSWKAVQVKWSQLHVARTVAIVVAFALLILRSFILSRSS